MTTLTGGLAPVTPAADTDLVREPVQVLGPGAGAARGPARRPVDEPAHRLGRAAGATGVGLWEWDLEQDDGWWSDGLAAIAGRPQPGSSRAAARWWASIHPADRARVRRDVRAILADGGRRSSACRVVRPDGEVRWVLWQGVAACRRDGRPTRLAGAVVDVTDDPEAGPRLAASVESTRDGYVALDRAWRVTHANDAVRSLLGDAVVGASILSLLSEAVDPRFATECREVLCGPTPAARECLAAPLGRWYEVAAHRVRGGTMVAFRDVTARHEAARHRSRLRTAEQAARRSAERVRAELEHAATHDALTGLANRAALTAWMTAALDRAGSGETVAICFLDLDRLKGINDSLGHLEGDRVLVEVARRLRDLVRGEDLIARIGGDEFVLATLGLPRPAVEDVARRVLEGVTAPIEVGGRRLRITTSVGIAIGGGGATPEALLRDADAALYRAKAAGGDRFAVFDEAVRAATVARRALEAELRAGVAAGELEVWYQPVFDLRTGACTGVEALARWHHPGRGLLDPADFLPVAEHSDLMVVVGERVLGIACDDAARWACRPGAVTPVWVNVSSRELEHPGFTDVVATALRRGGLPAGAIGVEVTEAALGHRPAVAARALDALHAMGVPLAVDDFGVGASSLARLAASPVRHLRIDRSFVSDLGTGPPRSLLPALVGLAHAMGVTAGAEGVETPDQLAALRAVGVDEVSGHLLARPVPAAELPAAVAAGREVVSAHR